MKTPLTDATTQLLDALAALKDAGEPARITPDPAEHEIYTAADGREGIVLARRDGWVTVDWGDGRISDLREGPV